MHILPTEIIYLQIFFFNVLTNLSAIKDFPSLCVEYILIPIFSIYDFIDHCLNRPTFCLVCRLTQVIFSEKD